MKWYIFQPDTDEMLKQKADLRPLGPVSLIYLTLIIIESYLAPLYAILPYLAGVFKYQSSKDAKESMVL